MKHTAIVSFVAFALVGCFASVRLATPPARVDPARLDLIVRVVPAATSDGGAPEAARRLAADLESTGVFARVLLGGDAPADLTAVVRSAGGVSRCGTPLVVALFTLGLLPGSTDYFHRYDFDLVSPSGSVVRFERHYEGAKLVGIWALPVRISSHWSRLRRREAPPVVADQLRADLLNLRAELEQTALGSDVASPNPLVAEDAELIRR
jgi:hypothetical protein